VVIEIVEIEIVVIEIEILVIGIVVVANEPIGSIDRVSAVQIHAVRETCHCDQTVLLVAVSNVCASTRFGHRETKKSHNHLRNNSSTITSTITSTGSPSSREIHRGDLQRISHY
jgi:hypothetical protein